MSAAMVLYSTASVDANDGIGALERKKRVANTVARAVHVKKVRRSDDSEEDEAMSIATVAAACLVEERHANIGGVKADAVSVAAAESVSRNRLPSFMVSGRLIV